MKDQKKKILRSWVMTNNGHMKAHVKSALKPYDVTTVESTDSSDEVILSISDGGTFYILDWESGEKKCLRVLEHLKKQNLVGLVPVMLIGKQMHAKMIAASYEYSISKVIIGEVSGQALKTGID